MVKAKGKKATMVKDVVGKVRATHIRRQSGHPGQIFLCGFVRNNLNRVKLACLNPCQRREKHKLHEFGVCTGAREDRSR